MIEFHEDEYMQYSVSDKAYNLVALLFGKQTAEKLLYTGDRYVGFNRLDATRGRTTPEERSDTCDDSGPFDIWNTSDVEESETAAPAEKVSALDRVG
ncbi:hypothetical protein [Paenibacillus agaridevorans]|uniref:hypothetical protein n=1 Tax=Paenibacillus agaridevorans TaxID=171404 RepID=UPI001BE3E5A6|nr:hypothetical protein [Paenibacillus agaridevorans]